MLTWARNILTSILLLVRFYENAMGRVQFDFLSSGWFKAVVIALPATVIFGPVALLGFGVGLLNALDVLRGTHILQKTLTYSDWFELLAGFGGILGLVGAWLRFLFQNRLSRRMSIFNWVVCFLLLSGVGASIWVFWDLYLNGVDYFFRVDFSSLKDFSFSKGPIGLLILSAYGTYLAITVVVPNHRLDPTSGSA